MSGCCALGNEHWGTLKGRVFTAISSFHRDVEICALLGYYAASCGSCLPTFRSNVSIPYFFLLELFDP
jgi:hypothetical protein